MKRARYTNERIVQILQEADRSPVAQVDKRHEVSVQTRLEQARLRLARE